MDFFPEWLQGEDLEEVNEEIANSITHLLGFLVSSFVTYFLVIQATNRRSWHHILGLCAFGFSMMLLYACSTTYHAIGIYYNKDYLVLSKWRVLDHIAIYYLIAGSYTPLTLLLLVKTQVAPNLGYGLLIVVWTCAIIGSLTKGFFSVDVVPEWVSTGFYLFMGWMALIAIPPARKVTPPKIGWWIIIGGLFYSVGVFFLLYHHLHFNHMIWHIFVLAGTSAHFIAVVLLLYLDDHNDHQKTSHQNFPLSVRTALSHLFAQKSKPNLRQD